MTSGHTMTIQASELHIEVWVDGEKLAESDRAMVLDETGLPSRYYLPRDDVRMERVRATTFESTCPLKGQASYWSFDAEGKIHDGIMWSYESPIAGAEEIAGLVCFYDDRVDLRIGS